MDKLVQHIKMDMPGIPKKGIIVMAKQVWKRIRKRLFVWIDKIWFSSVE